MVQGISDLPLGGGTISVLIKPGNLEMAAECRACQAAKTSSQP